MSLFGSGGQAFSSNSQSQAKPSLSFGVPNQQQSSSLFAQSASTQSQQNRGLFGTTTTNQSQAGTGLFGSTAMAAQPALNNNQSTGLFGSAQAQPSQQPGSSLFGSAQSSQPQPQGGLFGNTQPQPPSLFNAKPADTSKPSLFGLSSTPAQTPLSLVGGTANNNQLQQQYQGSNLSGFSLSQTNRQPNVIPGVRIDASNIRSTTRFNDLHEDIQSQVEKIDTFIQRQIQFKEQCDAMMPSHEANLKTIPEDVILVNGLVDISELGILNDSTSIKSAKDLLQSDADTARISFRAIETLKLPSQLRNQNTWYSNAPRRDIKPPIDGTIPDEPSAQDVVDYFAAEARKMTSTLSMYEKYLSEIEVHLQNVESTTIQASGRRQLTLGKNGNGQSAEDQVRELAAVLKEFEGGIYGVATKIGEVQDETQKLIMQPNRRNKAL